jgi:lipopolysaccharide transport system ATP-binding protein
MSDIAIRVEGLGKLYRLGAKQESYYSLRDTLAGIVQVPLQAARRLVGRSSSTATTPRDFWALKDVGFEVKKGESLGIIGRNGAGKSTLLKLLSEITEPTTGRISIDGRVASLLEVGTGFHPELSGRENIFLNGAILGMTRAEIKRKFDEIVAFAGVETFIDTQVKHYSSGMYLRLAFAVAAHLEPEILVVDEVLAVGDAVFQKKCLGKMGDVCREGRTVLLVSHNLSAIANLCTRVILLEGGRICAVGEPSEIIAKYVGSVILSSEFVRDEDMSDRRAHIQQVSIQNATHAERRTLERAEGIKISLAISVRDPIDSGQIAVQLVRHTGETVFWTTNMDMYGHKDIRLNPGQYEANFVIPGCCLRLGSYYVNVVIHVPDIEMIDVVEEAVQFEISDEGSLEVLLSGQRRSGIIEPVLPWDIHGPFVVTGH